MKTAAIAILFLLLTAVVSAVAVDAQTPPPTTATTVAPLPIDATAPVANATPPVLHDPVAHPVEALGDLALLKKAGWAAFLFALLVMVTRAGVTYSEKFAWLSFLAKGRTHFVLAILATFAAAAYNVLALGGTIAAALMAALTAAMYQLFPTPQPKPLATQTV